MDLNKFKEELINLEKVKPCIRKKPSIPSGGHVIRYIMDLTDTKEMDFDSFSIEDCESVTEYLEGLPLVLDDTGESFFCNPDNPLMIYYRQRDVIGDFSLNKQRIYRQCEGDIFL